MVCWIVRGESRRLDVSGSFLDRPADCLAAATLISQELVKYAARKPIRRGAEKGRQLRAEFEARQKVASQDAEARSQLRTASLLSLVTRK